MWLTPARWIDRRLILNIIIILVSRFRPGCRQRCYRYAQLLLIGRPIDVAEVGADVGPVTTLSTKNGAVTPDVIGIEADRLFINANFAALLEALDDRWGRGAPAALLLDLLVADAGKDRSYTSLAVWTIRL